MSSALIQKADACTVTPAAQPSITDARHSTGDERPSITGARPSVASVGRLLGSARAFSFSERALFPRASVPENEFKTF